MIIEADNGGFQVFDIALECFFAAISNRLRTHQRYEWRDRSSTHRLAKILIVIFGKGGYLERPRLAALLRPRLKALQTIPHIREEARFGLLAVRNNIDARFNLLAHTLGNCGRDSRFVRIAVVA